MNSATYCGADGVLRCAWAEGDESYTGYHDLEWARPGAMTDAALFERLTLESFQSGLSWRTILAKRDGFRHASANFVVPAIAALDEPEIITLLADSGIVRHRGKIEATINNAQRALDLATEHGGLAVYLRDFCDLQPAHSPDRHSASALSKDLRRRGWRFVGPTTVYAFLQAVGLVNDHAPECEFRAPSESARLLWLENQ